MPIGQVILEVSRRHTRHSAMLSSILFRVVLGACRLNREHAIASMAERYD
jgi:hypothetical protein